MREDTLAALETMARAMIDASGTANGAEYALSVRYFGNGARCDVRRGGDGAFRVVLYLHETSKPTEFASVVSDAIANLRRMCEKTVSIRVETLRALYAHDAHMLTENQHAEVSAALEGVK